MTSSTYRTPEQLDEDLLPGVDFEPVDARGRAIVHVLCLLPDIDYRRLCERFEKIEWYLPEAKTLSEFAFFSANTEFRMKAFGRWGPRNNISLILYLSPFLEDESEDRLREIVADKIAHVMLKHEKYFNLGEETAKRESEERRRTLERWGIEVE